MTKETDQEPMEMTTTEAPVEEGAPSWTMTFGDMMSLLLCFFILLFSMSELEVEKFRLASQSLSSAMGGFVAEPVEEPVGILPDTTTEVVLDEAQVLEIVSDQKLDEIAAALSYFVEQNELDEYLVVSREDHGVRLLIQDVALYEPGNAEIHPDNEWIIEHLGLVTLNIDLPFHVSGHTDTIPISNRRFRSNWELSAVRAAGVARTLVGMGQDPLQVRVEAFGEFRPISTNDTPEGRAQNRRVELFFSRQDVLESEWVLEEVEALAGPQGSIGSDSQEASGNQ